MSDDNLDFDAWLAGASITTTSVDILQNPALLGEYEAWLRRYQRAKAIDPGEYSMGEANPIAALEAEGEALLGRIEESRSTWHVRALTGDDDRAILAAFPDPAAPTGFEEQPPKIAPSPTEAQAKAFSQGWQAWQVRQEKWLADHRADLDAYGEALRHIADQRGAERISRAVVRIEQSGRTIATHVSAEQALTLPGKIGEAQVTVLMDAIRRASNEVPEVPVGPLSHGSGSDPE